MKNLNRAFVFVTILLIIFTGCMRQQAVPTFVPTIAIATAGATATPAPTGTATPEPSPTLIPSPTVTETPVATPTPTPAMLIGSGDVAYCGDAPEYQGDERTAELVEQLLAQSPNATVFIPGDTVYGEGTAAEYNNCFGPSWGRFKERIRPAPGNHDFMTDQGAHYYAYFGEAAGEPGKGWYSYDLGDWHIVSLNSNCNDVACGPNSEQVQWLEQDLKNNSKQCTLAYWHHPRFSSGKAGGSGTVNPFWRTVVENGVDVVVNGHDHNYERFAPLNLEGEAVEVGTRQFIVGTGGAVLRGTGQILPSSEVRYIQTYGVIQFKLYPGHYEWQFVPVGDQAQTDMGSGTCH